ncbi:pseudouridine synthase [Seohaeicola zhoushanensis]
MVAEGRITVNGVVIDSPALNVTKSDTVLVDGKPLPTPEPARLWLYHKPPGLVTTERDELGRATIFDNLPEDMPRVMSIGRLDLNSEGLLLLTNDGALKRRLELPSTGWLRRYRVRINGRPTDADFEPLRQGLTIGDETFLPMIVSLDRQQGANAWLTVGLREGKNREIRRSMEDLGFSVNRLIRLSYGPFQLGQLQPGEVEEVRRKVLRDQLGEAAVVVVKPSKKEGFGPRRADLGPKAPVTEEAEAPVRKRFDKNAPARRAKRAPSPSARARLAMATARRVRATTSRATRAAMTMAPSPSARARRVTATDRRVPVTTSRAIRAAMTMAPSPSARDRRVMATGQRVPVTTSRAIRAGMTTGPSPSARDRRVTVPSQRVPVTTSRAIRVGMTTAPSPSARDRRVTVPSQRVPVTTSRDTRVGMTTGPSPSARDRRVTATDRRVRATTSRAIRAAMTTGRNPSARARRATAPGPRARADLANPPPSPARNRVAASRAGLPRLARRVAKAGPARAKEVLPLAPDRCIA